MDSDMQRIHQLTSDMDRILGDMQGAIEVAKQTLNDMLSSISFERQTFVPEPKTVPQSDCKSQPKE